jgi:nicotinamidase-related amidase
VTSYTDPQWDRSALLVIDVQEDFARAGGAMPVAGTDVVLPALALLTDAFRAARRPIVHVIRLYEPGGSDVDLPRRAHVEGGGTIVAPGTFGSAIPAEILAAPVQLDADLLLRGEPQAIGRDEIVLYKPRWSAFFRTQLHDWLAARGVTTVVVAGCNLPNCPRATLFDASSRDYRGVVVPDATSQVTDDRIRDLALIGVSAVPVRQVVAQLCPGS